MNSKPTSYCPNAADDGTKYVRFTSLLGGPAAAPLMGQERFDMMLLMIAMNTEELLPVRTVNVTQ